MLSIHSIFTMIFITFSFPAFYKTEQVNKTSTQLIMTKWNTHVTTIQIKKCSITSTLESSHILPLLITLTSFFLKDYHNF